MQERQALTDHRAMRLAIVALGIVLGQAVLIGPSLLGLKILLPLDLLAQRGIYVPVAPGQSVAFHNAMQGDLVYYSEMMRRFAVSQLQSGQWPVWCPQQFAGAPSYRWSLSPPFLPAYLVSSPAVLAWTELLQAFVAGFGAYGFFRSVLGARFWPAAFAACCFPISAPFIFWQGGGLPPVVCWLPWMFWAVDRTVQRPAGWAGPALAVVTAVVLLGGQVDIAGQVLLASGLYAVWRVFGCYLGVHSFPAALRATGIVSLAWALGILASCWILLPLVDYSRTGTRMVRRTEGAEERPPVGLSALPQLVLPEMYGLSLYRNPRMAPDMASESSAAGYCGMLATLVVAPLAWCNRRHRSMNMFWLGLVVLGMSWTLGIPGFVALGRLPGLNVMSHNRFVFVVPFAVLAMAAVGLEVLSANLPRPRTWFYLPLVLLAALCVWCVYRVAVLPEPLATNIRAQIIRGETLLDFPTMASLHEAQFNLRKSYGFAAALSVLCAFLWLALIKGRFLKWRVPVIGVCMMIELLRFGCGYPSQCDPGLYFPPIPALEELRNKTPGRVIAYFCLPANLAMASGLSDIRGYDGVDPARLIDLLRLARDRHSPNLHHPAAQCLAPAIEHSPAGELRLSPIFDMLNVRYIIFRGSPPANALPVSSSPDYWVMENNGALPRVFIPKRVESAADDGARLERLGAADFDPRNVAYVETELDLPSSCSGTASIESESATSIAISFNMVTPGLVVLADRWDAGWSAYLDGNPVPILRTNHAVRGVAVPAGEGKLHFRYEPQSLRTGAKLASLSLCVWLIWICLLATRAASVWCVKRSKA